MVLTKRKSGLLPLEYLCITFKDVIVSDIDISLGAASVQTHLVPACIQLPFDLNNRRNWLQVCFQVLIKRMDDWKVLATPMFSQQCMV